MVVISCVGFKNPIIPAKIQGFSFSIGDSSNPSNKIMSTNKPLSFDATQFYAYQTSPTALKVSVGDTTVGSLSSWTLNMDFGPPLVNTCYV